MQRYEVRFEVDAPPRQVWRLFHPRPPVDAARPRNVEYPGGRMQILVEGDEHGQGLVRTCEFAVPRWLMSKGQARSWEVVTDVRPGEYARYQGVCKPLYAHMEGWHQLEATPTGGTRLTFVELYDVQSPILARLLGARLHRFISQDNERVYRAILGHLGDVRPVLVGA